jgi:hypothetical protein
MDLDTNYRDIDFSDSEGENATLKKQLTMIKNFIYDFDMDLQGYEWNGSKGKYKYTGDCLVDSDVRSKLLSSLKPFTSDINLITNLSEHEFSKMKYRTLSLINELLTSNTLGVPVENKRLVLNKYMNTIKLIGGVILGSKADIFKLMNGNTELVNNELRLD